MEFEKDSRTVFISQLAVRSDERRITDFFEKAGLKVRDVRLITDRNTRKSKGFGYVEFAHKDMVPTALLLSGQTLDGMAVLIKPSEAEKNFAASTSTSINPMSSSVGPTRLYVGSLHFNVTEEDLRQVFLPFGDLEFVQIHMDPETGRSKGFGFVQYKRADDAKKALAQLNGLELAGRQLKVGLVNETKQENIGGSLGELDDEGGGLQLNAQSRALLMAKLGRGALPNPSLPSAMSMSGVGQLVSPVPAMLSPPPMVVPTQYLLLRNMFDPNGENEPDFDLDIRDDVQDECGKYGKVVYVKVDRDSQGCVYVKFGAPDGATKAMKALHGRWFAGKMITAEYLTESVFRSKCPKA